MPSRVEAEHLVAAEAGTHKLGPAVAREFAGKELALSAEFLGFGIHVVHELVDQSDGDLLNLGLRDQGTLPTRMSRAVSMRRLVSVSSMRFLNGKLIQGDVVLDVFRNERAIFFRHRPEVPRREDRIRREVGELLAIDDVADLVIGDVRLEVGLDGRDGLGFLGLVVGDELGELLFQQLILGFETGNEPEDFFKDLAKSQTPIDTAAAFRSFSRV